MYKFSPLFEETNNLLEKEMTSIFTQMIPDLFRFYRRVEKDPFNSPAKDVSAEIVEISERVKGLYIRTHFQNHHDKYFLVTFQTDEIKSFTNMHVSWSHLEKEISEYFFENPTSLSPSLVNKTGKGKIFSGFMGTALLDNITNEYKSIHISCMNQRENYYPFNEFAYLLDTILIDLRR